MEQLTVLKQKFWNSQFVQYGGKGVGAINKFGKLNIVFIATVWFLWGETLIAENERKRYYGHTWIQHCERPTRTIFEEKK